MKISTTFKTNFIYIVALLHILLFTYAAVSKIMDFQNFQVQLGQSPLLTIFAGLLAYFVPAVEIILSILLMIPRLRLAAIYASCFLMFLFTVYIVMILNFTSFIPCSCGGVLEKLGWTEHLIFNIAFVVLSLLAILLHSGIKHTAIITFLGASFGSILMWLLFLVSEDTMHNENPFIRRFPQGTAAKIGKLDLKNTDFYIAGASGQYVYLGNRKAQLQLVVVDTSFHNRKQYSIKLNREPLNLRSLTITVRFPYFYVFDGSAPVIYKGNVSDWQASIISEKEYGFNTILFLTNGHTIIRGQKPHQHTNILAIVSKENGLKFKINDSLLVKQIDGFFDTDGTMQFSYEQNKMIYTYYYRNEYIVTDSDLNLIHRGKTIDTTTRAKLKVVQLKKTGNRKFAAPPFMVNKQTTVYGNLLMVNSMLRGKFETNAVWKTATVVDVYDFTSQQYLLSFYVHDENKFRMNDFYATKDALYILSGHYLLKLEKPVKLTTRFQCKLTISSGAN